MKFRNLLENYLTTADGSLKHNSLLLLDIDDTLLKAKGIYIYRKLPTDKAEVKLTPENYAKEMVDSSNKGFYDYRDFRDKDTILRSIVTAIPMIPNLKIMDDYIKHGWTIGILTARGMEKTVFKGLQQFLMFRNKKGKLEDIGDKLVRELVFAMNTSNDGVAKYAHLGENDFVKKKNKIIELASKYERIVFIDDDMKNINEVNKIKLKNVSSKLAKGI